MRPVVLVATVEGAAVRVKLRREPLSFYDRVVSTGVFSPDEARKVARELLAAADAAEATANADASPSPAEP